MTSRILIGCMLSDARSDCVAGRKYERVSRGVFHLPRNSGNSGWDVNGTDLFGSFHWKISGINGTSEKVEMCVPFTTFERSYHCQAIHGHIFKFWRVKSQSLGGERT